MNKTTEYDLNSLADTEAVAKTLAESFQGGEVIFAEGELGTGKTQFFKFIGKYLGVKKMINSPTFNLIKVYDGDKFTFYHVDCYRLESVDEEKKDLGLDEVLGDKNIITYIEWPQFASKDVLNYHPIIQLCFSYIDENRRKLVITDER